MSADERPTTTSPQPAATDPAWIAAAREHISMYGKQTETAIAAMSRLAEVYTDDRTNTRLSASDIAKNRNLQRPFVAKILTALSQAGLVKGSPGPGGGYMLARPPRDITLYDVFKLFEREDHSNTCPFGGGICGVGDPCPLHDKLVTVKRDLDQLLDTTFEDFRTAVQDHGLTPATVEDHAELPDARESYRAAPSGVRR